MSARFNDGRDAGDLIAVCDMRGFWLRKVSGGPGGRDIPCILAAWEDEPDAFVPWPIEDVKPLAEVPTAWSREEYNLIVRVGGEPVPSVSPAREGSG